MRIEIQALDRAQRTSATGSNAAPTKAPGAIPHKLARLARRFAPALCLVALGACDGAAAHGISAADARQSVDQLVTLFRPVDPTTTSDVQDRNFRERAALLEKLDQAGREAGLAALARYQQSASEALDVRWALLEVAAHNAPSETQPVLEKLIAEYDGEDGTGLRTQAVRILSEALPARAIEVLEPMIRDPLARATRPPHEELVRGWATAARKLGLKEARVLCDVVVDLRQPPEARYAATSALGEIGGERATKALREVLVEGASDGNIRRKAAQALLRIMPRKEFCALIEEISQHETDPVFLNFLADVLDKNCGGQ
ncbi:MAG: HEAT repeat domain-containing protein [Planctomycetes bacterium]|nr:HEAT repeat domain-containing protein [Planctomycetota bacterium]